VPRVNRQQHDGKICADESYFFREYAKMFDDLAALSFKRQELTAVA